ncbi:inositol monophosphatase [Bosea sp. (in: a-proteobacteria)]|jgi:myo-inositol-1(or 4)-monophosphatase|uniref:inositol monophosphatase family protein n=1 Tax=Bosea sp. (in: a-proteobacteria) TaxID=1871050 RepID=UPI002DDD3DC0|nr:inositol monophosphatase [Bosea sp. (in: a-proteobacteria)]HEV2511898.1 inositol monophosphatase [Bosea sp. (in: a-proteobacteria)]
MTPAELDLRQYAVLGLVDEASRLALDYFGRKDSLGISMKGAQDWLTVADGAVETFLRERLAVLFPNDAVIGEEGGGEAADAVWIIDPIDGTSNFARGDRTWCISIGLLLNGVPEIGIISAPALGEVYFGRRGRGATMNGEPIKVSGTADIRRAYLEFGWSTRVPTEEYLATVGRGFAAGASVKRSGSGALGLCHVAIGRTEAYAELHINAWDVAAGLVIATEAGADVNDFFAGDAIKAGNPVLCCTPELTAELERITGIVSRHNSR